MSFSSVFPFLLYIKITRSIKQNERTKEKKILNARHTAYYPLIIMITDFILIKIYGCYSKIYYLTSFWMCHIQNEIFVITLPYLTNKQTSKQKWIRLRRRWWKIWGEWSLHRFFFQLTVCGTAFFDNRFNFLLLKSEYNC